ncbi:MAG: hypothetical protein ABR906_10855 [Terracidiphilus sp.]|jgi:hypothetical protein
MKPSIWFFVLTVVFSVPAMFAQDARLSDPCNAMTTKSKNFLSFEKFDKELRIALTRQDALALAFLVNFPLRVNDAAGGTFSIDDTAALKTHFQEVFTPAVRKEILSEKNDNVGCMIEGIGYARGVIWVNASERGYAIWSVNKDAVPPYKMDRWNTLTIKFICQTQTHRIVIDTVAGGKLRYRAWNKPRSITEAPDLEIANGDGTVEGTNVCAVPIYTFKNVSAVYKVEGGLGCWGDSEPGPPSGATGRLEVTVKDMPETNLWCY